MMRISGINIGGMFEIAQCANEARNEISRSRLVMSAVAMAGQDVLPFG